LPAASPSKRWQNAAWSALSSAQHLQRQASHVAPCAIPQTGWVLARAQVGMLKMIRNLAFAHRSQHVQHGRFNTEDEVRTPN